jgi:hypothetical protein
MAFSRPKKDITETEAVNGTIQAVDVPVGAVTRVVERVRPQIEPLTDPVTRDPHIQKLREQVVAELKASEKRGAELRRKAVDEWPQLRDRLEKELTKARDRVEVEVREFRPRTEERLRKLQETAKERISALS